jgi:hypothetical protein
VSLFFERLFFLLKKIFILPIVVFFYFLSFVVWLALLLAVFFYLIIYLKGLHPSTLFLYVQYVQLNESVFSICKKSKMRVARVSKKNILDG